MESERTEVVDFSGEKFNSLSMPCGVTLGVILIITVLFSYLSIIYRNSLYAILLAIILFSIFILYYYSVATKSLGKVRKFSISFENIEFTLPYTTPLIVNWSEFEKIEITFVKFKYKPYSAFRFQFIGKNLEKEVTLSLFDFHKEKISEIIQILEEHVVVMNKNLSIFKETSISGAKIREKFF
jgi:hypothetical protein